MFKDFFQNHAGVVKSKLAYTTVRFAPLRGALDLASGMRPVVWLFISKDFFKIVWQLLGERGEIIKRSARS